MDLPPTAMPAVVLPGGEAVPALGLGTWRMGEQPARHGGEVGVLRKALEMGYRLIDTAEMYGEGGAERVVGEALAAAQRAGDVQREQVFVVSKVYPHNASFAGAIEACERSRERLQLDCIDLYLLHWRGNVPLKETVRAFVELRQRGWIRHWGVSNLDAGDMRELWSVPHGQECAADQIYYSLSERGPEYELAPWLSQHGVPLMAYSPIDQGVLARHPSLKALAEARRATPAQLALAWLVGQGNVMAIPKAARETHLRENLAAAALQLSEAERAALDRLFPPPKRRKPLAML